jgi:hypothetical protein
MPPGNQAKTRHKKAQSNHRSEQKANLPKQHRSTPGKPIVPVEPGNRQNRKSNQSSSTNIAKLAVGKAVAHNPNISNSPAKPSTQSSL